VKSLRKTGKKQAIGKLAELVSIVQRGSNYKTGQYINRLEMDFTNLQLEFLKKGTCLSGKIDTR
jgi:hypothetical protein